MKLNINVDEKLLYIYNKFKENFGSDIDVYIIGGAIRSLYHDIEPHDYDLLVIGITYDQLIEFSKRFNEVIFYEKGYRTSFHSLGKRFDVFLPAPVIFENKIDRKSNREQYENFLDKQSNKEEYLKECLASGVSSYSAGSMCVHVTSKKIITPFPTAVHDLKNKIARIPKRSIFKYNPFYILRFIKLLSIGFDPHDETYDLMINNNRLDHLSDYDNNVEFDVYASASNFFLVTLHRIQLEKTHFGGKCNFHKFVNLCKEANIDKYVFGVKFYLDDNYECKEEVLRKSFFMNVDQLNNKFGHDVTYQKFYEL